MYMYRSYLTFVFKHLPNPFLVALSTLQPHCTMWP